MRLPEDVGVSGPYLLGLMYDASGYDDAYTLAAIASALAGVCILAAGGVPKRREPEPAV